MKRLYESNPFEAAKLRYQTQTDVLARLTELDLRVFTGYITIQLLFGSWFSVHPLTSVVTKLGLMSIDIVIAVIAIVFLYYSYQRRLQARSSVRNLSEAFGFTIEGAYLDGKAIETIGKTPNWVWWYISGVLVGVLGVVLILFFNQPPPTGMGPASAVL
jgi:hypothetical protein